MAIVHRPIGIEMPSFVQLPLPASALPAGVLQEVSQSRQNGLTLPRPFFDQKALTPIIPNQQITKQFLLELHRLNPTYTVLLPDDELDRQASRLQDQFMSFDKYRNYRQGQNKRPHELDSEEIKSAGKSKGAKKEEVRWTDEFEHAFFKSTCNVARSRSWSD